MPGSYLIVLSAMDPVAEAVGARWGNLPATGDHVDGAPIRTLPGGVPVLRRALLHIRDDDLDRRLPASLRAGRPTLVFPSIHRSEQNVPALTVHPLGNPGDDAEVGGRPRTLNPTDPPRMVAALRRLAERAPALGITASYEATHHGPALALPSFFVEIGFGTAAGPPPEAVRWFAEMLPGLEPDPADRVALAIGGGHYAPHFSDLAIRRRWAFGHLLSKHVLPTLRAEVAQSAWNETPGADGLVYARAEDSKLASLTGLGPRRKDSEAARRDETRSTGDARSASGT
jgi:D-aminoacyl-tRNA deacylase